MNYLHKHISFLIEEKTAEGVVIGIQNNLPLLDASMVLIVDMGKQITHVIPEQILFVLGDKK